MSTVFLGLDYSFVDDAPPILFETMIFGGEYDQIKQWRYETEKEARENHASVVKDLQAGR